MRSIICEAGERSPNLRFPRSPNLSNLDRVKLFEGLESASSFQWLTSSLLNGILSLLKSISILGNPRRPLHFVSDYSRSPLVPRGSFPVALTLSLHLTIFYMPPLPLKQNNHCLKNWIRLAGLIGFTRDRPLTQFDF